MALTDVTGVFSRYFIVGFFMPAYISLVVLWLTGSSEFIPNSFEEHSEGTQLLILGGVALVVALALSGFSNSITAFFEGYWPRRLWFASLVLQRRKYDRLLETRDDPSRPSGTRSRDAWELDRYFPHSPERLLPTRLGNIMRASEGHSNTRWGLDGVTIWPRIEAVLSDGERALLLEARTNFSVLINATLGAFVVGVILVIDKAITDSDLAWWGAVLWWALYVIPFGLGYLVYRAAHTPAHELGNNIRSSVDLHRLDVYKKLGVRAPTSFSDERELALRVSEALAYGRPPLGDDLWGKKDEEAPKDEEAL